MEDKNFESLKCEILKKIKEKGISPRISEDALDFDAYESLMFEMLTRSRGHGVPEHIYDKLSKSNTCDELMEIIIKYPETLGSNRIVDDKLIEEYNDLFSKLDTHCNVDTESGFLFVNGGNSVNAYGNVKVIALDNSKVNAYGNVKVIALDNSKVNAWSDSCVIANDNAFVKAIDYSYVVLYDKSSAVVSFSSRVQAYDDSSVEAFQCSHISALGNSNVVAHDYSCVYAYLDANVSACDEVVVRAFSESKVKATGNSYVIAEGSVKCELSEQAVCRIRGTNVIRYAKNVEPQKFD